MKAFKNYFWTILLSFVVITLSIIPIPEVPPLEDIPLFDKWVHFLMYGAVACCVWYDYYRNRADRKITLRTILCTVVYPILLGGILELWQRYLTTCRSGEWLDFIADSIGTFLAFPIGAFIIRYFAKKVNFPKA
ncbi:MAG: VanZ family protein [Bacteroidaceae bacterium]|nr:VanZ family protein [Bacteroidaceae bacterium]